jgi:hypothetical protein
MVQSNLDKKLTKKQYEDAELMEKRTFVVDEAVKESKGYSHLGELAPRRNDDGSLSITVTEDHLKYKADDARQRRAAGKPVIPVFWFEDETGETHWVLNDSDAKAAEEGYLCINCLNWQKDVSNPICNDIHGRSCRYNRSRLLI